MSSSSGAVLWEELDGLVACNEFEAAIRTAVDANLEHRDPLLEQRIIEWRVKGFNQCRESGTPPGWPPPCSNRFADVDGIPEVDVEELDADALLSGILGKGGLVVRGLMDAETVELTRDHIDRAFAARKAQANGVASEQDQRWFHRSGSLPGRPAEFATLGSDDVPTTGSIWAVDCPPAAFDLIEFYRRLGLPQVLAGYFGEPATLSVKKWVLRCVEPMNGGSAGWHQDGRFLGDESIRTANLWVALSDCGEGADAPGIEIVVGNQRKIHTTGSHGADFDWTVGQGLVDQITQTSQLVCPRFGPGDAVFFDHYNLHRTGFGDSHTSNRYAVESWFFARSTAPDKQQPLLF